MLSELVDKGWVRVSPPKPEDDANVIARRKGRQIRAGFRMGELSDDGEELHTTYRSGKYDVSLKLDAVAGHGQLKVEEADGYE